MKKHHRLDLTKKELSAIPEEVFSSTALEEIWLDDNQIGRCCVISF